MSMEHSNIELQIILDLSGFRCVRIVGEDENQADGHKLYYKIFDLVLEFGSAVESRLGGPKSYEEN